MNLKPTYNKIAKDWQQDHAADTWWNDGTKQFASLLPKGGSVLDVGCGVGEKSLFLAKLGFSVLGFDFSEKMIELARRNAPNIDFRVWDLYNLDSLPGTYDGILAQAVLLHVPKEKVSGVLQSFFDKLKPLGYLYVGVKERREGEKEEQVIEENDYGYSYERFFSFFTKDELKELLNKSGFSVVSEFKPEFKDTRWIQVIAKKK